MLYKKDPRSEETVQDQNDLSEEQAPERVLVCKACANVVTTWGYALAVDGQVLHTFFNPAGLLFEISCFSKAEGCLCYGTPSVEFTWFANHAWRFAVCLSCQRHLGWFFESTQPEGAPSFSGAGFFGLIRNRLRELQSE